MNSDFVNFRKKMIVVLRTSLISKFYKFKN